MTTRTPTTTRLMSVLDARTGPAPRWVPARGATSPFALHELRHRRRR